MKIFDKNCTKNKYHNKTNIFSLFFSFFLNYMKRRRNELRSNSIPAVTASNRFKTIACNVTVTLHNHQWTFIRKCRNSLLRELPKTDIAFTVMFLDGHLNILIEKAVETGKETAIEVTMLEKIFGVIFGVGYKETGHWTVSSPFWFPKILTALN